MDSNGSEQRCAANDNLSFAEMQKLRVAMLEDVTLKIDLLLSAVSLLAVEERLIHVQKTLIEQAVAAGTVVP